MRSRRRGRLWRYGFAAALVKGLMIAHFAFAASPPKLLLLGDSLTAGYGLPGDQGFPAKLQAALKAAGRDLVVINGGVSGDTSAGGLARVDWLLGDKPDFAMVELGANDGLRALDVGQLEANIDGILTKLQAAGIPTLLAGMYAPPNLGREYQQGFAAVFSRQAEKHKLDLYPFFLDGVAADPALNQADGIHPNARGVDIIVERILPAILKLTAPR